MPTNDPQWSGPTTLFERALDCLPDGVLLIRGDRSLAYANQAFARLWQIPDELVQSRDDAAMLTHVVGQLQDPAAFISEVERLYRSLESSEDEILFKDGRIFSRRSVPFHEEGAVDGRIWVFTDVSEARQAFIDAGTGLPNRRAYARDFPKSVLAPEDGLFRSVAILDVDNFKRYNDIYGHAAGDAVLRRIGEILRSRLNSADDMAFRIGGEEFVVSCRSRREAPAVAFFESLRQSIADAGMPHAGNPPHHMVTVSMGVGVFKGPKDPGVVFERIDAALYSAKAEGRNRLTLASFE